MSRSCVTTSHVSTSHLHTSTRHASTPPHHVSTSRNHVFASRIRHHVSEHHVSTSPRLYVTSRHVTPSRGRCLDRSPFVTAGSRHRPWETDPVTPTTAARSAQPPLTASRARRAGHGGHGTGGPACRGSTARGARPDLYRQVGPAESERFRRNPGKWSDHLGD